jgi:hypothetical protein
MIEVVKNNVLGCSWWQGDAFIYDSVVKFELALVPPGRLRVGIYS